MKPNPNQKPNDVMSSSFQINITICDVDQETRHRLTTTIERKLRKAAVTVLIAENESDLTRWDLTCAIVYPKPTKQSAVIRNIRSVYIPPCFPEGMRIPGKQKKWLATATPVEPFNDDDSAFWNMHNRWSLPPWTMIHAGPGAAAIRVARQEGSAPHQSALARPFTSAELTAEAAAVGMMNTWPAVIPVAPLLVTSAAAAAAARNLTGSCFAAPPPLSPSFPHFSSTAPPASRVPLFRFEIVMACMYHNYYCSPSHVIVYNYIII